MLKSIVLFNEIIYVHAVNRAKYSRIDQVKFVENSL